MAATTNSVWNNQNQYNQVTGKMGVQLVMGQARFKYENGIYDFPNLVTKITTQRLQDNPEDSAWFKRNVKIKEIGNTGTVLYTFKPALLPTSNYSPSSKGVASYTTGLNVSGNNICFLQQEVFINEFTTMTENEFMNSIMNTLISSYPKSLTLVKQSLSLLECSLFCLATGQFYFANFLGKKGPYSPNNPNSVSAGNLNLIWSTQEPARAPLNERLGIQNTEFVDEAYALSDFSMKFQMSYGMWNVGFDMDKLNWLVSYFVKNNLAKVLGLGWPTETNLRMINNKTIDGAVVDRWFNFITSPTTTIPFLQNYIPQVTPEQLPVDSSGGQILGYGANNVMNFSFLGYLVAMSIFEGAIESYYTPPVPMNPMNIDNTKLWYRIGNVFGWGQVHVPVLWGTNYAFLDTAYGTRVTSFTITQAAAGTQDSDWTIQNRTTAENSTDPLITAVKTANGVTYTAVYQLLYNQILTDQTQAQALLLEWEPNMGYDTFAFPQLPTSITEIIPNNVAQMTYEDWLRYRDLQSQTHPVTMQDGSQKTIGDLTKIGWNQMTYSDWNITFAFPQDAPVFAN